MEEWIRTLQRNDESHSRDGDIFPLCDVVREVGYRIHQYLRSGHVEKVYENALAHRLRKQGIEVKQKEPLKVPD